MGGFCRRGMPFKCGDDPVAGIEHLLRDARHAPFARPPDLALADVVKTEEPRKQCYRHGIANTGE